MNKVFFPAMIAAAMAISSAHAGSGMSDDPRWMEFEHKIHTVMQPAPADFAKHPCIYVKRFNSEGSFDPGRLYGDGSARDGGVFAYLGKHGNLVKVATRNERRDYVDVYPLAKTEPEIVVLYFRDSDLDFNRWQTEWALNGQRAIPSPRKGICTPSRV